MSQKSNKKMRRFVKKNRNKIIRDFIEKLPEWPYWHRVKLSWRVLTEGKSKIYKIFLMGLIIVIILLSVAAIVQGVLMYI